MSLHDLSIEQAVLGACMISPRWMPDTLRAEHFYAPEHGALWEEMRLRQRDGRLIDFVALKPWAMNHPALSKLGANGTYLLKLGEMGVEASTSAHVASYGEMLRDMARRRAVAEAAKGALAAAVSGEREAAAIIAETTGALEAISLDADDQDEFRAKGEAAAYAVERAQLGEAQGVSTGFPGLDDHIGGLRAKLYLLGAASSMGKTTMAAAISRNVAAQGLGVVEFMLEMDEVEDGLRTASALAFERDHRARNPHYLSAQMNKLDPNQWAVMAGAARAASALPIWSDYRQGRTLAQIEASARRGLSKMRKQGIKPGLVVIDHEGLIRAEAGARHPNQLEATNARAVGLLGLPQRLGVPVLVTAQLTKDGKRADGEDRLPSTDDLKYGGALVEAAYAVMLLHRRAYYAERKPDHLRSAEDWDAIKSREATIVIDKARGGRRGKVRVWMDTPTAAVWEDAA